MAKQQLSKEEKEKKQLQRAAFKIGKTKVLDDAFKRLIHKKEKVKKIK